MAETKIKVIDRIEYHKSQLLWLHIVTLLILNTIRSFNNDARSIADKLFAINNTKTWPQFHPQP